jgi:hypothetical protein
MCADFQALGVTGDRRAAASYTQPIRFQGDHARRGGNGGCGPEHVSTVKRHCAIARRIKQLLSDLGAEVE